MGPTRTTMSWTNYFKRVERVQLEIPSDGMDWDDFKSYLVPKFPYYRLQLKEGDMISKCGYYNYVARIPRLLSTVELLDIEELRRLEREEHLPPKQYGGIRARQFEIPKAVSRLCQSRN